MLTEEKLAEILNSEEIKLPKITYKELLEKLESRQQSFENIDPDFYKAIYVLLNTANPDDTIDKANIVTLIKYCTDMFKTADPERYFNVDDINDLYMNLFPFAIREKLELSELSNLSNIEEYLSTTFSEVTAYPEKIKSAIDILAQANINITQQMSYSLLRRAGYATELARMIAKLKEDLLTPSLQNDNNSYEGLLNIAADKLKLNRSLKIQDYLENIKTATQRLNEAKIEMD